MNLITLGILEELKERQKEKKRKKKEEEERKNCDTRSETKCITSYGGYT